MSSGYQTDLADALKGSGLHVVETPGWKSRGHGGFKGVETIVCHHTAGPASGNMPSLRVVTEGRPGLDGPLCNFALGRDGTVFVVAAGVAYHAGAVGTTRNDNWHALGIEAEADGVSKWPDVQIDAYARLCAALCRYYQIPVSQVLGHKEVAVPHGRKTDPNFDMPAFRQRVVAAGSRKAPAVNNVENGRRLIEAGLAELRKAPKSRAAVQVMIRAVSLALSIGPKS